MADDIAGLAEYLGITTADVMGYSLGGGVALRTAVQHPELVKRSLSVVGSSSGAMAGIPEIVTAMSQVGAASAEPMKQTPMYQMYSRLRHAQPIGRCYSPKSEIY